MSCRKACLQTMKVAQIEYKLCKDYLRASLICWDGVCCCESCRGCLGFVTLCIPIACIKTLRDISYLQARCNATAVSCWQYKGNGG